METEIPTTILKIYRRDSQALNALFGNTEDATKSYTLGKDYTYVSANVIVDKSGNYYQYNATTHSYDQVNSATDMTVVTAGALSLTQVYGAGADILAKADAYTGNGTGYAVDGTTGALTLTYNSVYHRLSFSTDDGTFSKVGNVAVRRVLD